MKPVPLSTIERVFNSNDNEKIKVYTYQNPNVLDRLYTHESFITSNETKIWPEFIPAYDWMKKQMAETIDSFSGDYPIWAWLKSCNNREYRKQLLKENNQEVLITALVPRKRFIMSCYELWHCVLNNSAIAITEEEYDNIADQSEIEKTWKRCLGFNAKTHGMYHATSIPQLCIDRIYCDEIINIKYLP